MLRRRLSSAPPRRNVAYLKFSVMGEIAPFAILHSTDINRSSQDTQQLRASQTEPVRHGAGGGSTTRHSSFFFLFPIFFFFFFTMGRSQKLQCQKQRDCQREFAYLKRSSILSEVQTSRTTLLLKAPFSALGRHVLDKVSDCGQASVAY